MTDQYHPSETVFDVEKRPYQVAFLEAIGGQLLSVENSIVPEIITALETSPAYELYFTDPAQYTVYLQTTQRLLAWLAHLEAWPERSQDEGFSPEPDRYEFFWPVYIRPHFPEVESYTFAARSIAEEYRAGLTCQETLPQVIFAIVRNLCAYLDRTIPDATRPVVHRPARDPGRFALLHPTQEDYS